MKRLLVTLFAAMILLTACVRSDMNETTGTGGSETTAPVLTGAPTEEPTKPTEVPTEPTEPTELTGEELYHAMTAYSMGPDNVIRFTFDGSFKPYSFSDLELPAADLTVGSTYVYDELLETYALITDQPVAARRGATTMDHIFYVLEAAPDQLIRTGYDGKEQTVIYTSDYGDISWVDYLGVDANGKLLITEGNSRVVLYDIPTGEKEVLLEWEYIRWASVTYDSDLDEFYLSWSLSKDGTDYVWRLHPITGEPEIISKFTERE